MRWLRQRQSVLLIAIATDLHIREEAHIVLTSSKLVIQLLHPLRVSAPEAGHVLPRSQSEASLHKADM